MKNKKSIMMVSALLILIFHLWVNVTNSNAEIFIKQISYVGVDMFFFVSAYSLSKINVCNCKEDYINFVLSRFKAVYVKFVLFAAIAAIVSSWTMTRLLKAISYIDLFTKGGGAFLWFLPAIMLFYIAFPIFKICDSKNKTATLVVVVGIWAVVALTVTLFTNYKSMFIFWNRIPVFLLGYYSYQFENICNEKSGSKYKAKTLLNSKMTSFVLGLVLVIVGCVLGYYFGYRIRLQKPIYDMFYVLMIPLAIGLVILSGQIRERKIIKWIGSSTLEMYGIQMVFGYKIAQFIIKTFGIREAIQKALANIVIILIVMSLSIIAHYIYEWCKGKIVSFANNSK